jgi:hypothetical protein
MRFTITCQYEHVKINIYKSRTLPAFYEGGTFFYSSFREEYTVGVKAIPLQAWTGPERSWRLRLPDFKTIGT